MAKLSTDELLDAFKELSLIELSRVRQEVRGDLRGHRRRSGRRCRCPAAAGAGAAAEEVEEKDSFDVVLEAAGDKKIQVIKEVRELTTSASARPRPSSTAPPRLCSRAPTRRPPRRPRPLSKRPAQPSPSSSARSAMSEGAAPGRTGRRLRRSRRGRGERGVRAPRPRLVDGLSADSISWADWAAGEPDGPARGGQGM